MRSVDIWIIIFTYIDEPTKVRSVKIIKSAIICATEVNSVKV
jgi:hypothetical protein